MEEQIKISLPTELLERVDRMAGRACRSRADVITSALHRGLRDDERVQPLIDAFDEIDTSSTNGLSLIELREFD